MSSTTGPDWQAVEEAITLVMRDGKLPTRSKEAVKRGLTARNDSNAVLEALCVLDSLALNCGRAFRSGLAAPKWMKRLTQCCSASPQTAPAVAQLLANWELTFRGEELGASVHATRKQMQSNMGTLPQPNRFAHEMREYFEQHIPFIGFQHGFNFLEAFSAAGSLPSRGGELENTSGSVPPLARPVPPFRVEYLKDMADDLHDMEACTASIQLAQNAQANPRHEDRMRKGDALASKCCQWRASIQEWAADELLSYSLADMLVMNDRLHAELDRWESAVQSLVLAQSLPMVLSSTASDSTPQDHSQWFSPLGSSASRFMDTLSPSFPASASATSDHPASPAAAQERAAAASRSGAHGFSSASEPKAQPAAVEQQSDSSHGAGIMASGLGASRAGWGSIRGSTGFEASPLDSWVAFPDAAQAGMTEVPSGPQRLHAASTKPAQPPILAAQKTAQHSVAAQLRPVTSEAASVSFFSGPVAAHVPTVPSKQASSPHGHAQDRPQSAESPGKEAAGQADQDLLQWDSPDQQLTGQQRPGAAADAAAPTLSSPACESAPPRGQPSFGRNTDTVSGNVAAHGAQPFPDLSSSAPHSPAQAKPLPQASRPKKDLHSLQAQLDAERNARAAAEHALEASRAKEGALQRQLTELQDRLRDRELELWKAKLDAKADAKVGAGAVAGEGTGELKQPGKVHAITAWCHHPALRVRFSAGQLAALAAGTCSEA